MSGKSKIEWTEATWNPIVGCSVVSPGCTNCYAMRMAGRLEAMGVGRYRGLTQPSKAGAVWTGKLALAPESVLLEPLKRNKPTTYFVNSMGDLFHDSVPDEWIDRVFAVMALCPQHTFQVLTKRAKRMQAYFDTRCGGDPWAEAADEIADLIGLKDHPVVLETRDLPLPNIWLGVSTEDQQRADERIPVLLETPAAVRFISAEPLLGPIELKPHWNNTPGSGLFQWIPAIIKPDWVIVGGESGPDARPMNPQWARDLRDQCHSAGIAFFHKQNGEYASVSEVDGPGEHHTFPDGRTVRRVGKKRAGRLIDGRAWDEMPA